MVRLYREVVLETLGDERLQRVNFSYGPTRVYRSGYLDVRRLVMHRRIVFRLVAGNAGFASDARLGDVHIWSVSASEASADRNGHVQIGVASASTRGTIVHEGTHVLQDYQRLSARLGVGFTPEMAEGAAYLAGWIARLLWGMPRLDGNARLNTSHAYARWLAAKMIDGEYEYVVPDEQVRELNRRVLIGARHRYVYDGI